MGLYDVFRPYVQTREKWHRERGGRGHRFCPMDAAEIERAEVMMGISIPDSLRRFYEEIGFGAISRPYDIDLGPDGFVVSPLELAYLWLRTHEHWSSKGMDYDELHRRHPYCHPERGYWHLADDGEMPFFRHQYRFYWVLRPLSDKPNAVYLQRSGDLQSEDFADLAIILKDNPTYGDMSCFP